MEEKKEKRRKMLEQMLMDKRREMMQQIESHIQDKGEAPVASVILDVGDQSIANHETDLNLELLRMKDRILKDIDEALTKLQEDRYGICEQCGAEISPARLKAMPFARYCIACKEQQELFEKIEKTRTEEI